MTTETADAPARKKSKKAPAVPNENASPVARTAEVIQREIDVALVKREKIDSWDSDRLEPIDATIDSLRHELESAQLRDMPLPATGLASVQFRETSVLTATIKLTGNHREADDEADLERMVRSIKTLGLQQRVGLRSCGDGTYELIWGSRRLAACKRAGIEEIAAKVFPSTLTRTDVEVLRTIENFGRRDLTHVERAIAVARTIDSIEQTLSLLETNRTTAIAGDIESLREMVRTADIEELFASHPELIEPAKLSRAIDQAGGLHAYVGNLLGFPARWVKDNAYVARLGGKARELLAARRLDVGHARELAKLGDKEQADSIAMQAARNEKGLGGRPVDWVKQRIIERLRSLRIVPWRLEVAFGKDAKRGCLGLACATCPYNSKSDPDLFGGTIADEPTSGLCTNGACFEVKQEVIKRDIEKLIAKIKPGFKKGEYELTERGLAHAIPIHVKPAAAVRAAKKQLDPEGPTAGAKSSSSRARSYEDVVSKANYDYQDSVRQWGYRCAEKIVEAAEATPGRRFMLHLIGATGIGQSYNPNEKDLKMWRDVLDRIFAETFSPSLLELESMLDFQERDFGINQSPESPLYPYIAEKWDIAFDAMPEKSAFMPKNPELNKKQNAKATKKEPVTV